MSEVMKAVAIRGGTGDATSLFIEPQTPKPSPACNECLVQVYAFGLNRGDTVQREGFYPPPPGVTNTLGLEFSGKIVQVGEAEDNESERKWKVGDEVFGLVYGGAYAEFVVADKRLLIKKPAELSWENCAGMCESWFTALQALYIVGGYNPETTKSILWHAGASTVSICGIQLSISAESSPAVFATTRQDSKRDFCTTELKCSGVVNTLANPNRDWKDEMMELSQNRGMDLIIDFIGGPYFTSNVALAAKDGKIVSLGLLGGPLVPEPVDISAFLFKRLRYEGSTLRGRSVAYQVTVRELFEEKVLPKLIDGTLKNFITAVFKWENVVEAHKLMESNGTLGKIICTIGISSEQD